MNVGWMPGSSPGITTNVRQASVLIHRDPCELNHLAPFLGLVGDELAELGRRHRLWNSADFGKPRDQLGIFQRFTNRLVEDLHDLRRRALRRGDAIEADGLESRHDLGNGGGSWRTRAAL